MITVLGEVGELGLEFWLPAGAAAARLGLFACLLASVGLFALEISEVWVCALPGFGSN